MYMSCALTFVEYIFIALDIYVHRDSWHKSEILTAFDIWVEMNGEICALFLNDDTISFKLYTQYIHTILHSANM